MPDTASLRQFLNQVETVEFLELNAVAEDAGAAVWQEVNCLACANCCKTMSPQFTTADVKRIASFLRLSPKSFKEKWLYQTKENTWLNNSRPCQFLDGATNKCSIYAVRPADCAGFPYFDSIQVMDYLPTYKQNIDFCPATFKLVEKIMERAEALTEV